MRKHLLFLFIFSIIIVNVMGQSSNPIISSSTNTPNQELFAPDFTLSNAYPNPANSETKLDYKIPNEAKEAKIIIRSLLGHIMAEHLLEGKNGTKTIQTNDLAAGFYFYSLMIDGNIKVTRKLIVKH